MAALAPGVSGQVILVPVADVEEVAAAMVRHPAGSAIVDDPRRPGHQMLAVNCWCGRAFTVTPEEARRLVLAGGDAVACPNPDCGRGAE